MDTEDNDRVRTQVRAAYAKVAKGAGGCSVGCCGTEGSGSRTPTCACMGSCVCTGTFGGRPETCTAQNGSIACDNGIR